MSLHFVTKSFIFILPILFNKKLLPSLILYPIFWKSLDFFKERLVKHNIYGKDLHKIDRPIIPESMGILPSLMYLFYQYIMLSGPMHTLLLGICCVILLGFLDDVIDMPWRIKIILPLLATIPIIQNYQGSTIVELPMQLGLVNIGWLYYIYIFLLVGFMSNAINIYAGINGLETGQTLIIGQFSLVIAYLQDSESAVQLLVPFLITGIGLFQQNKFPAKVFVGDVWCYYSGMVLAVSCVEGRYGKTVLCLLIPQIFNFLYSIPQLLKIVPCPRHRIPKLNEKTGLLEDSKNMTLLNLVLRYKGPMSEKDLADYLLRLQYICCIFGLGLRYFFSYLMYVRYKI